MIKADLADAEKKQREKTAYRGRKCHVVVSGRC